MWWRWLGPLSTKKIIFCPQNDVWVHFDAVFNKQKTRIVTIDSLGNRFHGSIAKRTLQRRRKSYPKIHGLTRGGAAEHATG